MANPTSMQPSEWRQPTCPKTGQVLGLMCMASLAPSSSAGPQPAGGFQGPMLSQSITKLCRRTRATGCKLCLYMFVYFIIFYYTHFILFYYILIYFIILYFCICIFSIFFYIFVTFCFLCFFFICAAHIAPNCAAWPAGRKAIVFNLFCAYYFLVLQAMHSKRKFGKAWGCHWLATTTIRNLAYAAAGGINLQLLPNCEASTCQEIGIEHFFGRIKSSFRGMASIKDPVRAFFLAKHVLDVAWTVSK